MTPKNVAPGPELLAALRAFEPACAAIGCKGRATVSSPEWELALCLEHTFAFMAGVFTRNGDELVEITQ